ncbi:MAG: bifunctional DNA-formamidopyrimidine glycosylase/DNA-(apurinic or apyrimidinic site) lyase [Bryobacteraceae bacterium]
MPELPEVETIVRMLAPRLAGRSIVRIEIRSPRVLAGAPAQLARVHGCLIESVARCGKYLLLRLDRGVVTIHLGMTGSLRWQGKPGPHTRAVIVLDAGRLHFDDPRQFGRIAAGELPPQRLAELGPEAPSITTAELARRLAGRRAPIKALLMDQRIVAGLGNIYSQEALFRARIHPLTPGGRLSRERVKRLVRAIRQVLSEAIAAGGSSVSDYVNADGEPGRFQFAHRVYQRSGEPCLRCGTPIRRILLAQRGTHFCPRCQRL